MRRRIGILAALAIAALFTLLVLSATANAQETPGGTTPSCPTGQTCTDPGPPCPTGQTCTDPGPPCPTDVPCTIPVCPPDLICTGPINCPTNEPCSDPGIPACPPDVICTGPISCPTDEPCSNPGGPACPPDATDCANPPPCPDGTICVDPGPIPPPCGIERPDDCQFDDTDGDGWQDFTEEAWGSNPNDPNSTPEHGYVMETCTDGVDNDGDGAIDSADEGCNIDSDEDGVIDAQDNCPWDANAGQADRDADGTGDACDYDADNDGWDDFTEAQWGSNPNDANSTPEHWFMRETCDDGRDNDGDGSTDAADSGCAPDNDYDGVADAQDNCPTYWNQDQTDSDSNGTGDACEDHDGDGFFDGDEVAWGSDPNSAASVPEGGVNYDACTDGVDNDGDGAVDGDAEGCRITFEDGGAFPPSANGPGQPVPVAVRDQNRGKTTTVNGLPNAGSGSANNGTGSAWWLIAASIGALALVSGASVYGVRVRQRS